MSNWKCASAGHDLQRLHTPTVMPNSSSTWWESGSRTPGLWSQPGVAAFKFEHDRLEFAWVLEPTAAKTAPHADGMIPGKFSTLSHAEPMCILMRV